MQSTATTTHLEAMLETSPECPILRRRVRALWHGGAAVRQVVSEKPHLEVVQLPTAAPDLKQVWKATRRATSDNHGVSQLPALADQLKTHLP